MLQLVFLPCRPKRPPHSLSEFYEPESEVSINRQIVQGHNRYVISRGLIFLLYTFFF